MIKVDECLGRQTEGFMLGVLLGRYILQGNGHTQEVVDTLNCQSLREYLNKLAKGDLILQDQVLSGNEFDPEAESGFREMASQLLTVLDQVQAGSDESIWWDTTKSEEDS